MSSEPFPFDPALEELLHELARDPRSSLLRVQRPTRPTRWTDSWDALSRWSPGLTAAEKEILDVHRAEFATLLLQRWAAEIELRPPAKLFIARSSTVKKAVAPLHMEDLRRKSRRLHGQGLVLPMDIEPGTVLETDRPLSGPQMTALVTTAVQLHPTSSARIQQAIELVRIAQPRTAIGILRRLLTVEHRPVMRSYCWQTLAFAHGDDWKPLDLLKWYGRACITADLRLDAVAAWMLFAVQHGDVVQAKEIAQVLDAQFGQDHPMVDRTVKEQLRTRSEGRWTPKPVVNTILEDMLAVAGPTSRKVLRVLQ